MCINIGVIVIINVKNAHTDLVTLTLDLQLQTTSFLVYPNVIPYTSLNTLDHSFLSYAADKQTGEQTDRQTDGGKHLTQVDRLCRRW